MDGRSLNKRPGCFLTLLCCFNILLIIIFRKHLKSIIDYVVDTNLSIFIFTNKSLDQLYIELSQAILLLTGISQSLFLEIYSFSKKCSDFLF